MNKIFFSFLIVLLVLLGGSSFDNKTGIWKGGEDEKIRITELETKQKQLIDIEQVYSSENVYKKEILLEKKIILSKPRKNSEWKTTGLNDQNYLGNLYSSGTKKVFLKKKIGKDKFSNSKNITSLLMFNDNIIFSDDTGTIFNINSFGKVNWKKNIYKKIYKKIYKNLTFSIYRNTIYIADNIGFIYAINTTNGKVLWIKNHGVPIKSKIKIFDDKIVLIDQDNKIFCLNSKDGSTIWSILAITSFIKSQKLLPLAISKTGNLITITSSGDLFKIDMNDGKIQWHANTLSSLLADATDFFESSEIVITDNEVIFSAVSSTFSYNLSNGSINWESNVSSIDTPIISKNNIFFVTENGFFIIMNKDTGKIISSQNIFSVLKKKKTKTSVVGFVMGSGKLYSLTSNGYLIVSSALSGKPEYSKKIGDTIASSPVINDGNLYILTEKSRIIGFK